MKTICVFSGSSNGSNPAYAEAAVALGGEIACRALTWSMAAATWA
jgi:predicted Rossmann-fold nucleotide-binding protein